MFRAFQIIGAVLILAGIGLFLASSVGYSSAKRAPNIQAPAGMTVELPKDNPDRLKIEKAAEKYLSASLGAGGIGLVLILVGVIGLRQQKKREAEELERLKMLEKTAPAK